jgi:uncharacterized membrane protein
MARHLFLAHFPIALLVLGAAADLYGAALSSAPARRWAGTLLMAGAVGALLAFLTGQGALPDALTRTPPPYARVEAHTQWGGAGVWLLVGAGALRLAWRRRLSGLHGWALLVAAVGSAALVIAIAATGTAIAHGG